MDECFHDYQETDIYEKFISFSYYEDSVKINLSDVQKQIDAKLSRCAQLFIALQIREAMKQSMLLLLTIFFIILRSSWTEESRQFSTSLDG